MMRRRVRVMGRRVRMARRRVRPMRRRMGQRIRLTRRRRRILNEPPLPRRGAVIRLPLALFPLPLRLGAAAVLFLLRPLAVRLDLVARCRRVGSDCSPRAYLARGAAGAALNGSAVCACSACGALEKAVFVVVVVAVGDAGATGYMAFLRRGRKGLVTNPPPRPRLRLVCGWGVGWFYWMMESEGGERLTYGPPLRTRLTFPSCLIFWISCLSLGVFCYFMMKCRR